jgi:glycosyltransferase involved in cell wall biosynthesis
VLAQTFKDFEIILVDDGSPDSSGKMCDEFKAAHPEVAVKVVHKENEGLNYARRDGFAQSTGKYITFVDSDDLIDSEFLETHIKALEQNNVDMTICQVERFTSNPSNKLDKKTKIDKEVSIEHDMNKIINKFIDVGASLKSGYYMMTAWGKLYKRQLVEKINWNKSNYRKNEDQFETICVIKALKNGIVFIPNRQYFYRENPSSIMETKSYNYFNGKKLTDYEFYVNLMKTEINEFGEEYHEVALKQLMFWLFYEKLCKPGRTPRELLHIKKLLSPYITEFVNYSDNPDYGFFFHWRLWRLVSKFGVPVGYYLDRLAHVIGKIKRIHRS